MFKFEFASDSQYLPDQSANGEMATKSFLDNDLCFSYIPLSSIIRIFYEIKIIPVSATTTPGPLSTQTPGSRLLLTPTCNDPTEQVLIICHFELN